MIKSFVTNWLMTAALFAIVIFVIGMIYAVMQVFESHPIIGMVLVSLISITLYAAAATYADKEGW